MWNFSVKRAHRWAKIRQRGPAHFILVWGVLGWGVLTAAMFTVFMSVGLSDPMSANEVLVAFTVGPPDGHTLGVVHVGVQRESLLEKVPKRFHLISP